MNDRMKKLATLLVLATTVLAGPAFAQLRLTITSGVTDPIPIAIVPFSSNAPADGGSDVAQIIERDLQSSGRFKPMARADMITKPTTASEVITDAASWKQMRNDYVVVGRVAMQSDGQIRVEAELVNVLTGQRIAGPNSTGPIRTAAHRISDALYQQITGVRGAF